MAVCPNCHHEGVQITKDHSIPRWFIYQLPCLGMNHNAICNEAGFVPDDLIRPMCATCNHKKSGFIDFDDVRVQRYMRSFIATINRKIDKPKFAKRLRVRCGCFDSVTVVAAVPPKFVSLEELKERIQTGLTIPKEPHEMDKPSKAAVLSAIMNTHAGQK